MNIKSLICLLCTIITLNLQAQLNIDGAKIVDALTNPTDTAYNENYNNRNTHYFNLSMGFFNPVDFALSIANVNSVNGDPSPSINLDYNYGVSSTISLGAFASYYRVNAQYKPTIGELETILDQSLVCSDEIDNIGDILDVIGCINEQVNNRTTIEERLNVFSIGGKISAHKRLLPNIDTYAATYLGVSFNNRESIVESVIEEYAADLLERSSIEVPKFMYFVNAGARYYINDNIGIYGEVGYGNVHLAKLGVTYRF